MNLLPDQLGLAITTFALTNVDDLLLLSLLFARHPPRPVVVGQFAGVGVLVLVSLTGVLLGQLLNPQGLGWLGLLPIGIGLRELWRLRDNQRADEPASAPITRSLIVQVAFITIANGGDNVSVYVPLFATLPAATVVLFVAVFGAMVAVWCAASYYLVRRPALNRLLGRFGHYLLPPFLIGLGCWIVWESRAYALLG